MSTGNFSDKTWSGTPMWQIAGELEEQRQKRDAEEKRKASTPVAVLDIKAEGEHFLCELTLLIPTMRAAESLPDPTSGGFREVKVRGPRRKSRLEAVADGFELRRGFHDKGEAEVWKRRHELSSKTWAPNELPAVRAPIEQEQDREQRLRLAQRPRGTGWSRQKDALFFVHTVSPMAYDPKKMQYFTVEAATQQYVPCDPPHDPVAYSINVSAGASLVGSSDTDTSLPERPRTLLLKELVPTGRAMKKPLFFLDQPASCFVLFEGVRGSAAVDYCSKNFHTKLLSKLSSQLQYWSDALTQKLISSIFEELDAELLQQGATCYDGVSVGVAILLGSRLTVATLGAVRGLLLPPNGEVRELGSQHRNLEEGPERHRIDTLGGEVISGEHNGRQRLMVRAPLRPRQVAVCQDQASEIQRVLESAPDSFATLGFGPEDPIDGKSAKASYRRLALKVHPDKAPEDQKERAQEAFAKVEAALERVETLCDQDAKATSELHKVLVAAGNITDAVMSRAWARSVLGIDEGAALEDAEKHVKKLRKTFELFGSFADGRLAQPDAARAGQLLEQALEVLSAPVPSGALDAVPMARALGLRDLKRPRAIVTAAPQIEVVELESAGTFHLALLSSTTAALENSEVVSKIRTFPRQPKAASLVIAQDASEAQASKKLAAASCLCSSVIGVFEVKEEKMEEPPVKKAKASVDDRKVRCLHILLKHKDLKMTQDVESMQRMKRKPPVTRTVAQAERELLQMQRELAANPNIFHVLCRKHSECDTAMQPGQSAGDLGWITWGTCGSPHFESVMFSLKPYEISDIITTPRGMHIIQRIA